MLARKYKIAISVTHLKVTHFLLEPSTNYYFSDGLHLTNVGGQKLAKQMYSKVTEIFKSY